MDGGLNMVAFTKVMTYNLFIEKDTIVDKFGVLPDDIDQAIGASVRLCVEVLDDKTEVIGMKGQ